MDRRLSIVVMMVLVCVAAVDVAVARAFWSSHQLIVVGVLPTAVLLQVAAWQAWRGNRGRAFALGALAGGLLMTASFVYAYLTPEVLGFAAMGPGPQLYVKPGSWLYYAWTAYVDPTLDLVVHQWPSLIEPDDQPTEDDAQRTLSWKLLGLQSLVYSLPQWLAALVGGLLFWGAAAIRRRRLIEPAEEDYTGAG